MKKYTADSLPTEPGLYQSGAQVWELDDEGWWDEIHDDGSEFGDYELVRLTPVADTARAINDRIDRMRADGEVWTLGQVQRIIEREFIK